MRVSDLRSPYCEVGGIVYFGRMLDKVRLHADGRLPEEYRANLGKGFDGRCAQFLGVGYDRIAARTTEGGSDGEILEWCFREGRHPLPHDIEAWNAFMRKFGWNDEASGHLKRQLATSGYPNRHDIRTIFDFIDLDEGRDPGCQEGVQES